MAGWFACPPFCYRCVFVAVLLGQKNGLLREHEGFNVKNRKKFFNEGWFRNQPWDDCWRMPCSSFHHLIKVTQFSHWGNSLGALKDNFFSVDQIDENANGIHERKGVLLYCSSTTLNSSTKLGYKLRAVSPHTKIFTMFIQPIFFADSLRAVHYNAKMWQHRFVVSELEKTRKSFAAKKKIQHPMVWGSSAFWWVFVFDGWAVKFFCRRR